MRHSEIEVPLLFKMLGMKVDFRFEMDGVVSSAPKKKCRDGVTQGF